MEIIEKELEEKTIERMDDDPLVLEPEPVKKPKKKRTQAQIDAFEKARLARTEKIAARKKQKEEDKLKKKEQKKVIKQKVEEELDQVQAMDNSMASDILNEVVPDPTQPKPPSPQPVKKTTFKEEPVIRERFNPADPIVNNHYYYYGMPPQTHYQPPEPEPPRPKKSRRKKRPPTPSSSESESEGEEWTYQEEQEKEKPQYFQQPSAYKFNYA